MADRNLALLDLHLRETPSPPPDVVDALANEALVHLIGPRQHERIMHRAALRARIDEIDAERHRLNTAIVWPWRLLWRIRQIERLSDRLDALTEQSRALRTQLHEEGLARAEPEALIPLSDGRFAMLTPEGMNALHGWMYSGAFDRYVHAEAGAQFAEWTMAACERLMREWRVAWPPPTVSCAAALLARAGEERREALLDALIALFGEWRRRYRDCPADRLMLGTLMVLADDARGEPAEGERRALDYQQALHDRDFPLERETLWAGALLVLHGAPREIAPRVYAIWRGLIIAGWTMSAQTYPYAARLALAHGNPTAITSRVQGIFDRISPRVVTTTGTKAIAASVLAQSDLHPQPVRRTARILEEQTRWDSAAERLLALHERLPSPGVEIPGGAGGDPCADAGLGGAHPRQLQFNTGGAARTGRLHAAPCRRHRPRSADGSGAAADGSGLAWPRGQRGLRAGGLRLLSERALGPDHDLSAERDRRASVAPEVAWRHERLKWRSCI